MIKVLENSRGVALILTILVVSLIVALSLEFNRTMLSHRISAGNIGHGLRALYAAKSGVSCGLAVLMKDSETVDTLMDDWALPEMLNAISAGSQTLLEGGRFEVAIEDLSGKIPINSLIDNPELEKAFKRFLALDAFGLDEETVNIVSDSVMDWIDGSGEEDDLMRFYGAEDDYYMYLDRPYHCKNEPLDSVEEILLVKGVTPELFYGTEDYAGIGPYISVYGTSEININTADPKFPEAPPLVLSSLHDFMTLDIAEEMAGYRLDVDEDTLTAQTWYKEAVPDDIKIPSSLIKTTSNHFQITSVGRFGDVSRQVVAVVERTGTGFRVLSWEIG
jgi:general secretion pathway protein K